jgi:hypothetical protein
VWTEEERNRFITAVREARRDAQAVTIQAGIAVNTPKGVGATGTDRLRDDEKAGQGRHRTI